MSSMKRRRFLGRMGLLFAAPMSAKLLACGGDGGGVDAAEETFVIMNEDDADHTHQLVIGCSDLSSTRAVTYTATGPHTHTIMLTAAQLEQVGAGETVTISFTDGHSHTFNIARPDGTC